MSETKEITIRSGIKDAFNITTNVAAISQKEAEFLLKDFINKFLAKLNNGDVHFCWKITSTTTWKCSDSIYGAHMLLKREIL